MGFRAAPPLSSPRPTPYLPLPRFRGYELVEPVDWTRSNRHTGIRHMRLEMQRA
jgi:hypothetical protein